MTRLVTPVMRAQTGGSIVNILTFAAFEPDPDFPTSPVLRAGLADCGKLFSSKYAAALSLIREAQHLDVGRLPKSTRESETVLHTAPPRKLPHRDDKLPFKATF